MLPADAIHPIISILKEEVRRLKIPAVGLIAQETQDPFQVLISCLLSLRTRDETTEAASARLFKLAETPDRMRRLSTDRIEAAIYPVSFYRNKAKQILAISQALLEKKDRQSGRDRGIWEAGNLRRHPCSSHFEPDRLYQDEIPRRERNGASEETPQRTLDHLQ